MATPYFRGLECSFISRPWVLVSLIRHRTAKMIFAKAGCSPVNSFTQPLFDENPGVSEFTSTGNLTAGSPVVEVHRQP
jgi:hypothetical protein